MTRITVVSHEDLRTFMIIKIGILLRMRVFGAKVVETIKTYILYPIPFF